MHSIHCQSIDYFYLLIVITKRVALLISHPHYCHYSISHYSFNKVIHSIETEKSPFDLDESNEITILETIALRGSRPNTSKTILPHHKMHLIDSIAIPLKLWHALALSNFRINSVPGTPIVCVQKVFVAFMSLFHVFILFLLLIKFEVNDRRSFARMLFGLVQFFLRAMYHTTSLVMFVESLLASSKQKAFHHRRSIQTPFGHQPQVSGAKASLHSTAHPLDGHKFGGQFGAADVWTIVHRSPSSALNGHWCFAVFADFTALLPIRHIRGHDQLALWPGQRVYQRSRCAWHGPWAIPFGVAIESRRGRSAMSANPRTSRDSVNRLFPVSLSMCILRDFCGLFLSCLGTTRTSNDWNISGN